MPEAWSELGNLHGRGVLGGLKLDLVKACMTASTATAPTITIAEFERFHAKRFVRNVPPVSLREIIVSLLVAFLITPFVCVIAAIVPLIGIITAMLVFALTLLYLWARRSIVAFCTVVLGAGFFMQLTFMTIQSVKYNLEVPLFILTALGVPLCFLYSIFISTQIWVLRGGEQ